MNIQKLFQDHPEFRSKKTRVYIIELAEAIIRSNGAEVRYYCGSTDDLRRREQEHRKGKAHNGSPLLDLANQLGIGWEIVACWNASREFEKHIKRQKHIERFVEAYEEELPF